MRLLAGFFHLQLLNFTLDSLMLFLLLLKLNLHCEKILLETCFRRLVLGRRFSLRITASPKMLFEVLLCFEKFPVLN